MDFFFQKKFINFIFTFRKIREERFNFKRQKTLKLSVDLTISLPAETAVAAGYNKIRFCAGLFGKNTKTKQKTEKVNMIF